MKITKVSENQINKTKLEEKFESKPYKCPAGVWTIGYGTTRYFDTGKAVTQFDKPITEKEADRLLRGHYAKISILADNLCRDDLNQNQFDAVLDFLYNAGATYVDKNGNKKVYSLFNNINKYMPKEQLIKYWCNLAVTGGGKKLAGLVKRRKAEVELFFK